MMKVRELWESLGQQMRDYDLAEVAKELRAHTYKVIDPKTWFISVRGQEYTLEDRGGKIKITQLTGIGDPVLYGDGIGPKTLAYRLGQEIAGRPIDMHKNLD